jgi:hypothetical protein
MVGTVFWHRRVARGSVFVERNCQLIAQAMWLFICFDSAIVLLVTYPQEVI